MMQGPGSNDAGSPQKKAPKFFSRFARSTPTWQALSHATTPGGAFFPRAPTRRSTAAARCAAGGPGAEPLVLGNFGHFAHFLHPKKRRLWAGTAQGHARRHRALRPPYRAPFVPLRLARIVLHELPSPDCSRESRPPERQWQGQEERAGGSGNLEPAEASVMRPALPWRRTSTIHRAAVVQSRGASGSHRRGWGGDWWGVAGQQDQAGWVAQHPEAPPAPRRRRRLSRSAAPAPGGAPAGQDQ